MEETYSTKESHYLNSRKGRKLIQDSSINSEEQYNIYFEQTDISLPFGQICESPQKKRHLQMA